MSSLQPNAPTETPSDPPVQVTVEPDSPSQHLSTTPQQTSYQRGRGQSGDGVDGDKLEARSAGHRIDGRADHHGSEEEGRDDEEADRRDGLVAGLGGEGGIGHDGNELKWTICFDAWVASGMEWGCCAGC